MHEPNPPQIEARAFLTLHCQPPNQNKMNRI